MACKFAYTTSFLSFLAYDIISELVFGRKFGFMESRTDVNGLIAEKRPGMLMFGVMSRVPLISKIIRSKLIAPFILPKPTDKSGMGAAMGVCILQNPHLLDVGANT